MTDRKLLQLLKTDPDRGMDQLIRRYSGLVFALVRGSLADIADSSEIEDCAADVFIRFNEALSTFEPKASIKNYLCVIARNAAISIARKKRPNISLDGEDFFAELPDANDVEKEIAEKQLLENIFAELRRMGPPDADILLRKYYFGHSSKEIAVDLGMTVSAVDTRSHRAVKRLRAALGGKNEEEY